jgi:hypothetical protein
MTQIDQWRGGVAVANRERLVGPRGGRDWSRETLSDGRVCLLGPYCLSVPKWIKDLAPDGGRWAHCGGTTYQWSAWVPEPLSADGAGGTER